MCGARFGVMAGGSACSLRSQRNGEARRREQGIPLAHCVRSGMVGLAGGGRGFRLLTAFAAEWWGSPEGTGGDGRRVGTRRYRSLFPRRPSPPSSPRLRGHHSAQRASVERNLLHTSRQGRKPGRTKWHTANRMSRRDDTIECSLAALLGLQGLVGRVWEHIAPRRGAGKTNRGHGGHRFIARRPTACDGGSRVSHSYRARQT